MDNLNIALKQLVYAKLKKEITEIENANALKLMLSKLHSKLQKGIRKKPINPRSVLYADLPSGANRHILS
jgi:hypothetical protein